MDIKFNPDVLVHNLAQILTKLAYGEAEQKADYGTIETGTGVGMQTFHKPGWSNRGAFLLGSGVLQPAKTTLNDPKAVEGAGQSMKKKLESREPKKGTTVADLPKPGETSQIAPGYKKSVSSTTAKNPFNLPVQAAAAPASDTTTSAPPVKPKSAFKPSVTQHVTNNTGKNPFNIKKSSDNRIEQLLQKLYQL